jgi:hypothetical protein
MSDLDSSAAPGARMTDTPITVEQREAIARKIRGIAAVMRRQPWCDNCGWDATAPEWIEQAANALSLPKPPSDRASVERARELLIAQINPAIPGEGHVRDQLEKGHYARVHSEDAINAIAAALSPPSSRESVIETLREARTLCQRISDQSEHAPHTSDDYRRGFKAGASGCDAAILVAINDRSLSSTPIQERGDEAWQCAVRKQGTAGGNDPVDCNWPICGCDPAATKVIEALDEMGKLI